ncbi:unnamed protein product [Cylicocyclus nassatus]|uniref:Helicase ATP-binding domain-containing protein n=1 Tax=Cylicocyclus nassatus TaxID=53992 RepID=A0AA36GRM3_CYLNA|nr:unnamed protein product [Cylicocyclus nassatus]
MTSTESSIVLNEDRVFFTRDVDSSEQFSNAYTSKEFLKTLLGRLNKSDNHVQALVLITEAMTKIAEPMSVEVHACVGGTSINEEKLALAKGAHIIVGTPGRVKHMIFLGFLVLNALDLFVMYNFCPLLSKDIKEAVSSIISSLPEDIQKGKCVCTSNMPRAQRLLEQYCKEMSLCNFRDESSDLLERDVPTPESGIDDGVEAMDCEDPLEDEHDQANLTAHTHHILAAIRGVDVDKEAVQVLVIAPRKEDVKQILDELQKSLSSTKILVHGCCEQTKLRDDGYVLSNGVHVLIASPQRACHLLRRQFLHTDSIQVLVMVKADELFCTGFKTLLHDVIQSMPESVQCVLLSGKELIHASEAVDNTVSPYEKLAPSEPREPVMNRRRHICIEVQDDQQSERTRDFCRNNVAAKKTQFEVLCDLYEKLEYEKTVIICKWPKKAIWIQEHLAARGYHIVCLVGMKTKKFREEMQKFESSSSGVVLITETSANLFKEKEISVIVNYEMPRKAKGYVGRVAPMDLERERTVVNLVKNNREANLMETVQSQYGISIEHFINPHCIKF